MAELSKKVSLSKVSQTLKGYAQEFAIDEGIVFYGGGDFMKPSYHPPTGTETDPFYFSGFSIQGIHLKNYLRQMHGYFGTETIGIEQQYSYELVGLYSRLNDLSKSFEHFQISLASIASKIEPIISSTFRKKIYTIEINNLPSNKWDFVKPVKITIEEKDEDDYDACLYEADIYGYGDTIPQAVQDLAENILNQYEALLKLEKNTILGKMPESQLKILRKMIKNVII